MTWALNALITLLALVVVAYSTWATTMVRSLRSQLRDEQEGRVEDSRNRSTVEYLLSRHHTANALRNAAENWDTPDGQHDLRILSRQYVTGGPSVGAMWLSKMADDLDGGTDG